MRKHKMISLLVWKAAFILGNLYGYIAFPGALHYSRYPEEDTQCEVPILCWEVCTLVIIWFLLCILHI